MRLKVITALMCIGFLNCSFAQVIPEQTNQSSQELYDFHISKKKTNSLAGWIALGAGVGMIVIASANTVDNLLEGDLSSTKGEWLYYLGGASVLTSIPLFIATGKHKRKAMIQLQNGALGVANKIKYSGVSVTLSF